MITYKEAINILSNALQPLPDFKIASEQAHGVLARDVISTEEVPNFSNSAMDGFAVRSVETNGANEDNPVRLEVRGCILAGELAPVIDQKESCCEIMTGSVMPSGFDAVIPVEQVEITDEGGKAFIVINQSVQTGRNVRFSGEDFKPGQVVAKKGQLLNPHILMAINANKIESVSVYRPPNIGILTTGSELETVNQEENSPTIPNTNGPFLQSSIRRMGIPCNGMVSVGDSSQMILEKIQDFMDLESDIIIISGGVSAGKADFVPGALNSLGAEILFHKVWIRPGKPILMAKLPTGQFVFGLPGNPVSVAVGFRFFVNQAIRILQDQALEESISAINKNEFKKPEKFCFFAKAQTGYTQSGNLETEILSGQESFKLSPFYKANSWMILPEGTDVIKAGEKIEIMPLQPGEAI